MLPLIDTLSVTAVSSCAMQADTLRNQLDQTMEEFKTKETDRDAQKKQLTSVIEDLLRKVHVCCVFVSLMFTGCESTIVCFLRRPRCSSVVAQIQLSHLYAH